mgnify:CR=1 FL=1|tara:strand:+ start:341 stop:514 length:174 start_codon:yes stop_codon:yes gene_type:complete
MQGHLDKLRRMHRDLNREIDTTRAPARQDDVKRLKKLRLMIKDRVAQAGGRRTPRKA